MQDFTKDLGLAPVESKPSTSLPTNTDNKNWLSERLNRDNAWNLAFIVGIILGAEIIGFWLALGTMALVLRLLNPVKFIDGKFFSSSGREIDFSKAKILPTAMIVATIISFLLLLSFCAFSKNPIFFSKYIFRYSFICHELISFCFSCILFITDMPFSIVINYNYWKKLNNAWTFSSNQSKHWTNDPSYNFLKGNIFHR